MFQFRVAMFAAVVFLVAAISPTFGQEAAKIGVTPHGISERRVANHLPGQFEMLPERLTVTLRLDGPPVLGATQWHGLHVDDAVDDLGADLKLATQYAEDPWIATRPIPCRPRRMDSCAVSLNFQPSHRQATRIARLRGQFVLQTGGDMIVVRIPRLGSAVGKPVNDPALAAARLTLQIEHTPLSPYRSTLRLALKGELCGFDDVRVLSSDGKPIATPAPGATATTKTINLEQPLDNRLTLNVTLFANQKTITVPFEVHDIPLP